MKILTKDGKALLGADGVLTPKPYTKCWGYYQEAASSRIDLYDWIYKCLLEGFSVQTRTVDGVTYTVDGGDSGISHAAGIDPDHELHWLVIPLAQFDLHADTETTSIDAFSAVFRVISDNPELLATLSPSFYSVTTASGKVTTFQMHFPHNMSSLNAKRLEIMQILPTIDEDVFAETSYSRSNKPTTAEGKAAVAAALHDWLVENVDNNAPTDIYPYYWTHNAYNCLKQATPRRTDCNGFAVAYAMLCQLYDINCIPVYGGAGNGAGGATSSPAERTNHEWNILSLTLPIGIYTGDPSLWYAVDVRFDEYVSAGQVTNANGAVTNTRYFFCTDQVYVDVTTDTLETRVNNHDYRLRANNIVGYPVDVPTGVWNPQESETQGGGA